MSGAFELSWTWDIVFRFLSIALINVSLSGDNAIAIGMAAASLDRGKRKWAIGLGGGLAILLRILLTTIAALLMRIPLLSAVGGCLLFWVAWKLLRLNGSEAAEGEGRSARQARSLSQAIILILTADLMMSLDNVIAIAGTANGNIMLIICGLLLSMPLLMTTGGLISLLIDKFKWLVSLGAAVIVFAGTRMIFEDRFIEARVSVPLVVVLTVSAFLGISAPLLFGWIQNS